jgi:hypothetical protein
MVEQEQTSTAEQRLRNHVPATTNSNERVVAGQQVVKHEISVKTNTITEDS